ncbi:TPA: hypothetical protein N2N62_000694 [Citrobacter freundii]|uniref:hypothetical protein n=1 Tax=Enterobacteriaceae TaxID=543 RepID=UPI00128620F4|nr:hypothetical protein [Citrobacter freundii]EBR0247580.1 hypothetical protein [Salmonella enterica subsp. enterica serovar Corvallis]EBY3640999.1 hypothetical protein [Salmonella enterica subsp. enterica serovar Kentucky]EGI5630781.1 hypothetical protein [Salmonella enterica subsp. enterica serovar Albany]HAK0783283.1 hypothetical protein [Salmonella enterica]EBX0427765.1 hypothetical protein [Salmonella enterica subsp. enterica serovar Corvallis]
MPVYSSPEELSNGFTPAGSVLPAPTGFDVPLPEGTNPEPQQPEPSVWGAAFRRNNILSGLFRPAKQFEPVEGYNPYTDKSELHGYEQWGTDFADSRSPEETAWLKQQIDDQNEDQKVLYDAGGEGVLASIAAGMVDPVTVASLFIPGAQGGAAARIASQAAIGAVATAASEVVLNNQQITRTWGESAAHVAAGALMSGVFAAAGTALTPSVRTAATREVADALDNMSIRSATDTAAASLPEGGSVGAARINEATLEDLTPATGGPVGKLARKAGSYLTPFTRLMESPSKTSRRTALELAENNYTLQGNARGIETPVAAETRVRGWRREEAAVVVANKQAYGQYKAAGGDLSFSQFREEVGNAMRSGDVHANPVVQEAAQAMRTVVNRVKVAQQKLGLLPPDDELKAIGQESYFPRVYKVGKIANERDKFRDMLVDWWSRGEKTMSREEAEIAADTTINRITGAKIPQDFANVFMVKAAGSTRARTLSVPDRLMKDYLESDANYVLQRHIREASAEVELTRAFGNKSLEKQLKDIQDEYDALMRERPAEQAKLAKARENDIRDITALRDRLAGTYGMPDDPSSFFVRAGAFLRSANFVTKLGGMTISAIPDLARGVMVNGFSNTMRGYSSLITRSPAFKASRAEQLKMAVGLETILHTRARTMGDLVDSSARTTAVEAGMERVTDAFGKLTMMGHFDDMNKSVNGMITSDGILSGAFAGRRLAKLGINDNMAARIRSEFEKHGEVIDGWHIGNFEKWDDQHVAGVFQSAVLKDVNNTVITPGIGDTPLWASTPLGKTIFQFKSFATASYNRATLGGLQEGTGQFYYGTAFQIALGALTYALKQAANGKDVDWTPQKLVIEGIDRSGILGPLMEYNNMAEKATGGMIGLGALLGTGTQSRYASRGFIGSALGPTFGLLDTITDVTAGVLNGDAGDRVLHNVRTLLPGNNLFWIAPLINQVDPGMK